MIIMITLADSRQLLLQEVRSYGSMQLWKYAVMAES